MIIKFDRTAFQNETSVLTNFEKKYEVSDDTTVGDLLTKFRNQHLQLEGLTKELDSWRILVLKNMAWRELAIIVAGKTVWINGAEQSLASFLGSSEPVTLLAIHEIPGPEPGPVVPSSSAAQNRNPEWRTLNLPIRVETKVRQFLALSCGLLAVASVYLLISQYQLNKAILTEAIISAIAFGLAFYFLLLKGRRIIFRTKTVIYRNRYNRYEKFHVSQFEHVEWMNHGETVKFVFRYEEKGRNYISADSEKYLELIVWAVSNGIRIYTTDRLLPRSKLDPLKRWIQGTV